MLKHVTRTYSEKLDVTAIHKALDNLEPAFIAWGRAGANSDVTHPLREPWLRAREMLIAGGRLK